MKSCIANSKKEEIKREGKQYKTSWSNMSNELFLFKLFSNIILFLIRLQIHCLERSRAGWNVSQGLFNCYDGNSLLMYFFINIGKQWQVQLTFRSVDLFLLIYFLKASLSSTYDIFVVKIKYILHLPLNSSHGSYTFSLYLIKSINCIVKLHNIENPIKSFTVEVAHNSCYVDSFSFPFQFSVNVNWNSSL